jgi:hypothetical protein
MCKTSKKIRLPNAVKFSASSAGKNIIVNEPLLFLLAVLAFDQPLADADCGVNSHSSSGNAKDGFANLVGTRYNPGAGNIYHWQSFVEWSHGVPKIWFSTTDTAVSDTYRPNTYVIETDCGTVGKGLRSFTADLVEAVTELMIPVAVLLDKTTFVKMSPTFTMVMNSSTISKERTVQVIESR